VRRRRAVRRNLRQAAGRRSGSAASTCGAPARDASAAESEASRSIRAAVIGAAAASARPGTHGQQAEPPGAVAAAQEPLAMPENKQFDVPVQRATPAPDEQTQHCENAR